MYPILRRGDKLPTVALLQVLINRAMREGEHLTVDGIFGPNTQRGLRATQHRLGQSRSGQVDESTWRALMRGQEFQVIDAVDVTDPDVWRNEAQDIQSAGGDPIMSGGMCDGIRGVTGQIQRQARSGRVVLLRFFGHGNRGVMMVAGGTRSRTDWAFTTHYMDGMVTYLARLRPIFSPFGSAELHGCRVGAGSNGRRLLRGLCRAWEVPVTAGLRSQSAGGRYTFRFEGPTITMFPGGGNLRSWARSLPEPAMMSVAR
jgi:hypothetical protein